MIGVTLAVALLLFVLVLGDVLDQYERHRHYLHMVHGQPGPAPAAGG